LGNLANDEFFLGGKDNKSCATISHLHIIILAHLLLNFFTSYCHISSFDALLTKYNQRDLSGDTAPKGFTERKYGRFLQKNQDKRQMSFSGI
jgi:hypothetical protein